MIKQLAAFLMLFMPTMLIAQNASVNGYITDKSSGETLISANVALLENNRGTSTNTLGYFSLTNLEPGTYTIAGSYIGFKLFRKTITLSADETLRLDIELEPNVISTDEIVVTSDRVKEEQKDIGTAEINTELIKSLPKVFEADVFRSIQLLPGVKAASDFSSGLYIRGGSPDQTLILLDRNTVYNPSHFFGFFSTFNPDAIKDVRLYKGGYPAEYGGRLSSVLTIYNKDGNRNKTEGTATLGMLASRVSVEGPYKRGSWMFSARRSTLEPVLAALRSTSDNIPSSFYFFDFNGKVNYDATKDDKLSLAFYSGQDKVNFPFGNDAEFKLNYGNRTLSGNWTHIFNEKLFSNFVLTGSQYFNYPELELGGTPIERRNNIYDYSIKADLEYLPNEKHDLAIGIWAGTLTIRLNDRFDNEPSFSSRSHSRYGSVYISDTWRPSEKWKVVSGIRTSYLSDGDYFRIEPRFSLEYKANDRIRLQTAYGRYNQYLTLITNEAFSGFDVWLTADDGVKPSFGDQFIVGAKTIPILGYGFDIELYYRTMNDIFELDPFIQDVSGLDYPELFRIGNGDAYGAEFFFEKRSGNFTGFVGYTFAYTWKKFAGYNNEIGNPDANGRRYPPKYDRRNDLNLVLSYQLSKRWKSTLSFNYATGQAYTEVLGQYSANNTPWANDELNTFTVGKINASRLPPYHRMDVSFSRLGTFFGLGEAEWQFQIINVYSRRNIWFYNFDFDENPVERTEVPLLPLLPTISYTVNF
ncbi:MAG: TonB-dependent receptor [Balneola sp.]|nr:TonB-dependent receptor [Balneola sp.]MBO6652139.1 TonB-dependent receptor [Balneola sp.]MBO6710128.1 TonB-dependent receptor [Balneola sp.]MBO6798812.1 TonB-dependent receptor [Balneola sp.]MBO6869926.1 TonB-dependent receptor [Balneola sp.]